MTMPAAAGWAFGVTFAFILLRSLTLSVRPGSTYDLVTQIACQAIAYLLGLFLILRVHAPEAGIRETIGLRRTHPLFYPLALLLGVAVEIPADGLYDAIVHRWPTGVDDKFAEVYRDASSGRRVAFGLLLVVAGPALEEVFFRGALFRPLLKTHPVDRVILATAALFAFAHLEWQMFLPIGVVGLALAFLRRRSGSLLPSFLTHAAFNGVSFALMVLSKPDAAEGAPLPWAVVAAAAGAAVVLVGLIHVLGARSATAARARELDLQ
jgi:membrane protease YdiL (CAAX protease family)